MPVDAAKIEAFMGQVTADMAEAGFTRCRRATETLFNLVLEARP